MGLIDYQVNKAGWATLAVRAEADEKVAAFGVSYLHDSLGDLARMGLALNKGQSVASAVFMEEPGEVHLVVEGLSDALRFEVRWFDDWASWNMADPSSYKVLSQGEVGRAELVRNIQKVLARIHSEIGPARYLELWIEHEFPLAEYEQLSEAMGLGPIACRT